MNYFWLYKPQIKIALLLYWSLASYYREQILNQIRRSTQSDKAYCPEDKIWWNVKHYPGLIPSQISSKFLKT